MPRLSVSGPGISHASSTVIVCPCGAKTAVPRKSAGNVTCSGCGAVTRIRR
jgi:hypothetical protein